MTDVTLRFKQLSSRDKANRWAIRWVAFAPNEKLIKYHN